MQSQIKITSTNLNLRSEPNPKSSIIAVIPKGTNVTLSENCDCKWISVSYNGYVGYINSGYLRNPKSNYNKKNVQNALIETDNRYYTVTNNLNVRTSPSNKSAILGQFNKGQNIHINGFVGKWVSVDVQYRNEIKTAYVHGNYLRKESYNNASNKDSNLKSGKNSSYSQSNTIKYYTNSEGERVQSPTYYDSPPPGATALCRDGTYSFSRNRRGTCSHHGGVAKWL